LWLANHPVNCGRQSGVVSILNLLKLELIKSMHVMCVSICAIVLSGPSFNNAPALVPSLRLDGDRAPVAKLPSRASCPAAATIVPAQHAGEDASLTWTNPLSATLHPHRRHMALCTQLSISLPTCMRRGDTLCDSDDDDCLGAAASPLPLSRAAVKARSLHLLQASSARLPI
jgi:hypothetical protein